MRTTFGFSFVEIVALAVEQGPSVARKKLAQEVILCGAEKFQNQIARLLGRAGDAPQIKKEQAKTAERPRSRAPHFKPKEPIVIDAEIVE